MKTIFAITIMALVLAAGCTETAKITSISEPKELHEFQAACFGSEGVYSVYYLAIEPASYEREMFMCETSSIHSKFEE